MLKRAAEKVARADTACWPSLCLHCSMLGRFILMNTEPCKSLAQVLCFDRSRNFDVYGTLLQIGERRRPFRNLLKQARSQRQPRADDARTLMTQNVGLAGAANLFGTQLGNVELATLELDLYAELASVRPYDDALRALESLKRAGLKVALCSNLATLCHTSHVATA